MNVLLVDNAHFYKTPDGAFFTPSIYGNTFFDRYLSVFTRVKFTAKVKHVEFDEVKDMIFVDMKNIDLVELPWYRGIKGLLRSLPKLVLVYRNAYDGCCCAILRMAQVESIMAYVFGRRAGIPLAAEIVNDPNTLPEINVVTKWTLSYFLRRIIRHSVGVSYVTEEYLQKKYPCNAFRFPESTEYFTANYSSVELSAKDITEPKKFTRKEVYSLVHVTNTISGEGKGHKMVIDVAANLCSKNIPVKVEFIGDGPSVDFFRQYAELKGVSEEVVFRGRISDHKTYMKTLRDADIFIFPTHSEGLPRVIIEAMACGLPCISTPVGGITELLEPSFLLQPDDVEGYSNRIQDLLSNPTYYDFTSLSNTLKAKQYEASVLQSRRFKFYQKLSECACPTMDAKD